jgi:hypothetical protein
VAREGATTAHVKIVNVPIVEREEEEEARWI